MCFKHLNVEKHSINFFKKFFVNFNNKFVFSTTKQAIWSNLFAFDSSLFALSNECKCVYIYYVELGFKQF